jgi:hypothetical protein
MVMVWTLAPLKRFMPKDCGVRVFRALSARAIPAWFRYEDGAQVDVEGLGALSGNTRIPVAASV